MSHMVKCNVKYYSILLNYTKTTLMRLKISPFLKKSNSRLILINLNIDFAACGLYRDYPPMSVFILNRIYLSFRLGRKLYITKKKNFVQRPFSAPQSLPVCAHSKLSVKCSIQKKKFALLSNLMILMLMDSITSLGKILNYFNYFLKTFEICIKCSIFFQMGG